jgi:hypothetical protein
MHVAVKRRVITRDNLVLVVAGLIAICAVIMEGRLGLPQRWHAATTWTIVPFAFVAMIYHKYWISWRFWTAWTVCLAVHLLGMWLIFSRLLVKVQWMGTMYVMPLEFLEGLALVIPVGLLMRKLGHKGKYIYLD